ncbi:hypothetical protein BC826DRAFT_1006101 [Russula brevipes]|nr:hypothetical protein BC826DRAFT_1006101 [Russula brevipes]
MEATLRERLVSLEQQFLLPVLSRDDEALEEFSREWSQLSNHIKAAAADRKLDDKTALLFFQVSGSLENVANCMLQSEAILQDAQSRLIKDLIHEIPTNAPETLSQRPPIAPYHLLFSSHSSLRQATLGQHKALGTYAYRWLMQNLHDPYPTTTQMQVLGVMSGTTATQVDTWFEEIRDTIGWTKLSREFFASSPRATIAMARRVYLQRDNDVPFSVVFAFMEVKAIAETLFLEHPALQERRSNKDHGLSCALPDMSDAQGHSIDSETIFDPFRVDSLTPPHDLPHSSGDVEGEDTTPPPAVAGCKRRLIDDVLTSEEFDLDREPKRYRTQPVIEDALLRQESASPALSTSGPPLQHYITCATAPPSADMPTIHTPSEQLSQFTSLSSSHEISTSVCHKRGRAELGEVDFIDGPPRPVRRQKVFESASPVPSKPVCDPCITPGNHLSLGLPSSNGNSHLLPLDYTHTGVDPVVVGVNVDVPSNPSIFDWNSIPAPPTPPKDVVVMCRLSPSHVKYDLTRQFSALPACIYVPGSDLPDLNLELPHFSNPGHHLLAESSSACSRGDPPLFGDPNCLPPSPISGSPSTPLYSESSSALGAIDWTSFTEFIDQAPASMGSSSQMSLSMTSCMTSCTVPTSQEGSLSPPFPTSSVVEQPVSLLDSSTPPSAFLPVERDIFSDDINMWPLLYGSSQFHF